MLDHSKADEVFERYMGISEKILGLIAFLIWIDIAIFMTTDLFIGDIIVLMWLGIIYYIRSYVSARHRIFSEYGHYPSHPYMSEMTVGIFWAVVIMLSMLIVALSAFFASYFVLTDVNRNYSELQSFIFPSRVVAFLFTLTVGVPLLCVTLLAAYKILTGRYLR